MKKLLIALAAVIITVATHAQGTVVFNNRDTSRGFDAPITLQEPAGTGVGTAYTAGLYFNGALVPGSAVTFRGDANGPTPALAKYFVNPNAVVIPGTTIEQVNVPVQVRVWQTSAGSYEAAASTAKASSGDLIVAQLGGGLNPAVANYLPATFTGLVVPNVPEPSTIALGVLGAAALLYRRRK